MDRTADFPTAHESPRSSLVSPALARNGVLALLLTLNLGLRLYVAMRPLEFTDGLTIPDDTYLSLTLARNIASGDGPTYAGEHTNGFQPLFVYLMVPAIMAAGHNAVLPVHIAAVLSSVFDSLTLLVLCRMVLRRCRFTLCVVPLALTWIFNPIGIRTAANGMETSMSCFFLAMSLSVLDRHAGVSTPAIRLRAWFGLGMLIGLGLLARIDNIVLAATVIGAVVFLRRRDLAKGAREAAVIAAGTIFVYLPWLAFSFVSTGDLSPVSGRAIRLMSLSTVNFSPTFQNWYSLNLNLGIDAVARTNRCTLLVAALVIIALLISLLFSPGRHRGTFAWIAPAWAYALLLFPAYTLYVFGPWFFERYLFPITIAISFMLAACSDALLGRLRNGHARIAAVTAAACVIISMDLADPDFGTTLFSTDTTSMGYMNIGLWAKKTFPPGTVIASTQSGALGYFADSLRVFNLDGVVSKTCYESLLHFRGMTYLREHSVMYVVGWYNNFLYLAHQSVGMTPRDMTPPREIKGFTSWRYAWYVARVRY